MRASQQQVWPECCAVNTTGPSALRQSAPCKPLTSSLQGILSAPSHRGAGLSREAHSHCSHTDFLSPRPLPRASTFWSHTFSLQCPLGKPNYTKREDRGTLGIFQPVREEEHEGWDGGEGRSAVQPELTPGHDSKADWCNQASPLTCNKLSCQTIFEPPACK